MDEIAAKRAVQRADKTQKVIDSTEEAWDEFDADLWKMFKATKSGDQDKREEIYREYHAAEAIKAKLARVVNEGKKAEEELKQQKAEEERKQQKVKHGDRRST